MMNVIFYIGDFILIHYLLFATHNH